MKALTKKIALALVAAVAAWGLTACGGGVECGSGTKKADGKCVPLTKLECGNGTTQKDGKCILGDSGCEAGTTFDSESGTCVVDGTTVCDETGTMFDSESGKCVAVTECGPDTEEQDGKCVPTNVECTDSSGAVQVDQNGNCVIAAAACGDGAQLDPMSGTCKKADKYCPEGETWDSGNSACVKTEELCGNKTTFKMGVCMPDETCQMGDVVLNSQCVSPAKKLAANPDVAESENNDPSLGGMANSITVKATGKNAVFTGAINKPKDHDGDKAPDQDWDVFKFSAKEGDWFQISVQSLGLPQPYFMVKGPNGWMRTSPKGTHANAARQILIPEDGDYEVWVGPTSKVLAGKNVSPVGNADWKYVGSLTKQQSPMGKDVDLTKLNAKGNFQKLSDNVFTAKGFSAGTLIDLKADVFSDNFEGIVSLWKDATTHVASFDMSESDTKRIVTPKTSNDEFLIVVDWRTSTGLSDKFELSATEKTNFSQVGTVMAGGSKKSSKKTFADGDTHFYSFSASAGQVIEFTHTSSEGNAIDYELQSATGTVLDSDSDYEPEGSIDDATHGYWYTHSGGSFIIKIDFADGKATDFELTVNSNAPSDLGKGKAGDTLSDTGSSIANKRSAFYKVELTARAKANYTLSPSSGEDVDFFLYDTNYSSMISNTGLGGDVTGTEIFKKGVYIVRVEADEQVSGFSLEFDLKTPPIPEMEPNNATSSASSTTSGREHSGTIKSGDTDYWEFDLKSKLANDEVFIVQVNGPYNINDWKCEFLDSMSNTVKTIKDKEEGCTVIVDGLAKGKHYLKLTMGDSTEESYTLTFERTKGMLESNMNDTVANADSVNYSAWTTDTPIFGEVPSSSDTDIFEFSIGTALGANDFLALSYQNIGQEKEGLDVELQEKTMSGTSKIGETSGTSGGIAKQALKAGTYYIQVDGGSSTDDNQYRIEGSVYSPDQSASKSPGAAIPENTSSGVTSSASISGCSNVTDIAVQVDSDHGWSGDVIVEITGPNSNTVRLHDETGSYVDYGVRTYPLTHTPANPLSPFVGNSGNGSWTLKMQDTSSYADNGTFKSWSLLLKCQ